MDKYWLRFLVWSDGNETWLTEPMFWKWFYEEVLNKHSEKKLKDYLDD